MKTKFVRAAFVAALMSTAAAVSMTQANADDSQKVGAAVGKPLSEAQKALQTKDYKGALVAAQEAQAVANQTPFETYKINSFLMAIEIGLGDQAAATKPAEDAADSPAMPDEDKKDMLRNALILSSIAKDYVRAISYGQKLNQASLLDDQTAAQLAVAYYETKDLANAKIYAQKSVDMTKAAGKQANEAAMQILMNSQATSDPKAAEATLEQVVITYNRLEDWDRLVAYSLNIRPLANSDALNMFRLDYLQRAMQSADDYTFMVSLAETQRAAVEARNVADAGIAAGKVTAAQINSTLGKGRSEAAADEKIISQAIAAAEKSKRGEDNMQIAQDLWGYGRYAEVESMATAAKAKGGLKDPGEANVLIGMAQIAQGKYDAGIATLGQVSGSPGRMRTAHLWTIYAQAKQKAGGAAPAAAQ